MSYNHIAQAAQDVNLRLRVAACISTQTGFVWPERVTNHPIALADSLQWELCGSPGWGDAYAYAVANEIENPGADESVITDAMILSAVQSVLGIT